MPSGRVVLSTLMTCAPISCSRFVHKGPAHSADRSTTMGTAPGGGQLPPATRWTSRHHCQARAYSRPHCRQRAARAACHARRTRPLRGCAVRPPRAPQPQMPPLSSHAGSSSQSLSRARFSCKPAILAPAANGSCRPRKHHPRARYPLSAARSPSRLAAVDRAASAEPGRSIAVPRRCRPRRRPAAPGTSAPSPVRVAGERHRAAVRPAQRRMALRLRLQQLRGAQVLRAARWRSRSRRATRSAPSPYSARIASHQAAARSNR